MKILDYYKTVINQKVLFILQNDAVQKEAEAVELEKSVQEQEMIRDQMERKAILLGQRSEQMKQAILVANTSIEALKVDVRR